MPSAIQYGPRVFRIGQYVHASGHGNGKIVSLDSGVVSGLDNCSPLAKVSFSGRIKLVSLSYMKPGWVLR